MIRIVQRTKIAASSYQVWSFLTDLTPERYTAWHPQDHLAFRRLRPPRHADGRGQRVYFRERIGPRTFGFSCSVSRSQPSRLVEFTLRFPFSILRAGRGVFVIQDHGDTSRLTAVVELGWKAKALKVVVDPLIRKLVDISALRTHMDEEGEFLDRYVRSHSSS